MLIKRKQLIGLSVRTKSGEILGQVSDFELDTDNSEIIRYIITSSRLVKKILASDLLIDKSQIIEINDREMVVEDGLIENKAPVKDLAST